MPDINISGCIYYKSDQPDEQKLQQNATVTLSCSIVGTAAGERRSVGFTTQVVYSDALDFGQG